MRLEKIFTITSICVVTMWVLNPSLESHRPVAAKHIRNYIVEKYDDWYVPNAAIDVCTRHFAEQLERESYIIFSVTRLRRPEVFRGMELSVDTITSIGFLGMCF